MVDIHEAYSKNMFGRGYSAETVRLLEMRRDKEREGVCYLDSFSFFALYLKLI